MAEDERCLFDSVPLHQIAAADAARPRPNQQLTRAYLRHRHLLKPHVAVIIINGHLHKVAVVSCLGFRVSG